ncbi:hypothetical protein GWI33_011417 [Rhynchophorus ferrugineus]|uniref:Uncharacterized protein n=1 Tax=Rhynchophorus ferrugineus TaxID=354439 RepID=A0A834IUD0_RHYFE|nr:hypothetical protein GWI33_011417 [Rhynchophorus ferrugineus]
MFCETPQMQHVIGVCVHVWNDGGGGRARYRRGSVLVCGRVGLRTCTDYTNNGDTLVRFINSLPWLFFTVRTFFPSAIISIYRCKFGHKPQLNVQDYSAGDGLELRGLNEFAYSKLSQSPNPTWRLRELGSNPNPLQIQHKTAINKPGQLPRRNIHRPVSTAVQPRRTHRDREGPPPFIHPVRKLPAGIKFRRRVKFENCPVPRWAIRNNVIGDRLATVDQAAVRGERREDLGTGIGGEGPVLLVDLEKVGKGGGSRRTRYAVVPSEKDSCK